MGTPEFNAELGAREPSIWGEARRNPHSGTRQGGTALWEQSAVQKP